MTATTEKPCTLCRQAKPSDQFDFSKTRRDGLASYCKSCMRRSQRISVLKKRIPRLQAKKTEAELELQELASVTGR